MTQALVRQAFETRLETWADAQSIEVAWENTEYKASPNVPYARAFLVPDRTESLFLDQSGRDFSGFFQINLNMPVGAGAGAAEALAASLDSAFGGSFVQGSIRVTLLSPMSAAAALPVADRYVVPVSAAYRVVTV